MTIHKYKWKIKENKIWLPLRFAAWRLGFYLGPAKVGPVRFSTYNEQSSISFMYTTIKKNTSISNWIKQSTSILYIQQGFSQRYWANVCFLTNHGMNKIHSRIQLKHTINNNEKHKTTSNNIFLLYPWLIFPTSEG